MESVKEKIIDATEKMVRQKLEGEGTGHDWWHIHRVRNLALHLAHTEGGCNLEIVELAALLHDIDDWKFNGGDEKAGGKIAKQWLISIATDFTVITQVCDIIDHVSYKGSGVPTLMRTIEGMIVQDADRLDALGAIGIARAFAYGGSKSREFYNPEIPPQIHISFEAYKKNGGTTINHFYEKLLLLKDRMQTTSGRKIAEQRHEYMKKFLEQFYTEWNAH